MRLAVLVDSSIGRRGIISSVVVVIGCSVVVGMLMYSALCQASCKL